MFTPLFAARLNERAHTMKIGILGSGAVAQALAAGFLQHGHQVMLGSGTPSKLADWAAQHPGAKTGSFADAAAFAELAVLAAKGTAAPAGGPAAGGPHPAREPRTDT